MIRRRFSLLIGPNGVVFYGVTYTLAFSSGIERHFKRYVDTLIISQHHSFDYTVVIRGLSVVYYAIIVWFSSWFAFKISLLSCAYMIRHWFKPYTCTYNCFISKLPSLAYVLRHCILSPLHVLPVLQNWSKMPIFQMSILCHKNVSYFFLILKFYNYSCIKVSFNALCLGLFYGTYVLTTCNKSICLYRI